MKSIGRVEVVTDVSSVCWNEGKFFYDIRLEGSCSYNQTSPANSIFRVIPIDDFNKVHQVLFKWKTITRPVIIMVTKVH